MAALGPIKFATVAKIGVVPTPDTSYLQKNTGNAGKFDNTSSNPCRWSFFLQVFGSRVRVDGVAKVAELELAEKEKMKEKVERILSHNPSVFINRYAQVRTIEMILTWPYPQYLMILNCWPHMRNQDRT